MDFPTRITKSSSSAIYNIFIDKTKNVNYTIEPAINGLSDHDAQILVLHDIKINNKKPRFAIKRQINDNSIAQFKINLSYESWTETFKEESVDTNFKNFLNTYLRIFNHSFPYEKFNTNNNNKAWLTKGIKTSCQRKRDLYMLYKYSQEPKFQSYYKNYTIIL